MDAYTRDDVTLDQIEQAADAIAEYARAAGWFVTRDYSESTSSRYVTCSQECRCDDDGVDCDCLNHVKIRIADHSNTHHCDYSVRLDRFETVDAAVQDARDYLDECAETINH